MTAQNVLKLGADDFTALADLVWGEQPPKAYEPWVWGKLLPGNSALVTWVVPGKCTLRCLRLQFPEHTGVYSFKINGRETVSGFLDATQFRADRRMIEFALPLEPGTVLELGVQREDP